MASQKQVILDNLIIFHLTGTARTPLSTYPTLKEDFDY